MPSLTTYRARVLNRLSAHSGDSFYTNTRLDEAINAALTQVSSEHDWPWLQTTLAFPLVPGTNSYALGATFLRVKAVTNTTTGSPLSQRTIGEIDQILTSIIAPPSVYAVYNNNLEVRPTPATADQLTIRYYRIETPLVAGTDVSLLPDQFSEGVIEYAAYLLYRAHREPDKSAEAMAGYQGWLKRNEDNIKQSREPFRVIVRPGSEF